MCSVLRFSFHSDKPKHGLVKCLGVSMVTQLLIVLFPYGMVVLRFTGYLIVHVYLEVRLLMRLLKQRVIDPCYLNKLSAGETNCER